MEARKRRIDFIYFLALIFFSWFFIFKLKLVNILSGDTGDGIYAIWMSNARIISEDGFPLWNPHLWGGFSNIGHIFASCYPILYILLRIFWNSETQMLSYMIIPTYVFIHIIIYSISMFYLVKRYNKNSLFSFIISVMCTFCGCTLYAYGWLTIFVGMCWIPLMILSTATFMQNSQNHMSKISTAIIITVIAQCSTAHGVVFAVLVFVFLYFSFLYEYRKNKLDLMKLTKNSIITGVLGILLSTPIILPFYQFLSLSFRYVNSESGVLDYNAYTQDIVTNVQMANIYGGKLSYIAMGLILFLLCTITFFIKRTKYTGIQLFSRFMFVFGVLISSGLVFSNIMYYIPGFNKIRELLLYTPLIAISAGLLASESLSEFLNEEKNRLEVYNIKLVSCVCIIICVASLMPINNINIIDYISKCLTAICILLIFLLVFKQKEFKNKHILKSIILLVINVVIICDYVGYCQAYNNISTMSYKTATQQVNKVNESVKKMADDTGITNNSGNRVLVWSPEAVYPTNTAGAIGLYDICAYLNPSYEKTWNLYQNLNVNKKIQIQNIHTVLSSDNNDDEFKNYLSSLLNKDYIQYEGVYASYDAQETSTVDLYDTSDITLGSAWIVYDSIFYSKDDDYTEVITQMNDENTDLSNVVLINRDYYKDNFALEGKGVVSNVTLSNYGNNKISYNVETDKNGILVTSEFNYPGWNCYIDGKKTEIVEVNYAFGGVNIQEGNHTVEFKFEPKTFYYSLVLVILVVLGLFLYLISFLYNNRKVQREKR